MNEDNPPMVAPSGAVYSEKALSQIAAQHNGMFKDPETGVCSVSCICSTAVHSFVDVRSRRCDEGMLLRAFPWTAGNMCEMDEMKRAYFS